MRNNIDINTRDATIATTTVNTTILDDTTITNVETSTTTSRLTNRLPTVDDTTIIITIGGISRPSENSIEYHLGYYERFDEQTNLLNGNAID